MKVLGVDPGLSITGYGLVEIKMGEPSLAEAGLIRLRRGEPVERRLSELYDGAREIMRELSPDVVVVEEVHSQYSRPATAIMMGHARGVLFLAAAKSGIPVVGYSAAHIKKAVTGNGRASKGQVQRMVRARLKLSDPHLPEDVSDALAVALCHCNALLNGGR